MKTIRAGVIGLGGIGFAHLEGYQRQQDVAVVAACDTMTERIERARDEFGVPQIYTDYGELCDRGDLDVISVCTGHQWHAEMSIAALRSGCHVLCVKPMAMNALDARSMCRTAREAGRQLMIGQNTRLQPEAQILKRLIEAGRFGRIYYARTQALRRRGVPGAPSFYDGALSTGGPLLDIGVHVVDAAVWLMDFPKPLAASGQTYCELGRREDVVGTWDRGRYGVEDLAVGFIRFEGGLTLSVEASFAMHGRNTSNVTLFGTHMGAEMSPPQLYWDEADALMTASPEVPRPGESSHYVETRLFVDAVREEQPVPMPGEQSLVTMKILDAIYASTRAGGEVPIPWEDGESWTW